MTMDVFVGPDFNPLVGFKILTSMTNLTNLFSYN